MGSRSGVQGICGGLGDRFLPAASLYSSPPLEGVSEDGQEILMRDN